MNYKVEVKCQAVQFDGNLVNMPNWFLDKFLVGKQDEQWFLFNEEYIESEIHLGDYVVLYGDCTSRCIRYSFYSVCLSVRVHTLVAMN